MGAKLAEAPPGYEYVDPGPGVPYSPDLPPLHEAFGAHRRDDGQWAIPELDAHIGSTSGSLHHGATQVLLEAAAMDLAADATGNQALQIEDWDVMFVGPRPRRAVRRQWDTIDGGHGPTDRVPDDAA